MYKHDKPIFSSQGMIATTFYITVAVNYMYMYMCIKCRCRDEVICLTPLHVRISACLDRARVAPCYFAFQHPHPTFFQSLCPGPFHPVIKCGGTGRKLKRAWVPG